MSLEELIPVFNNNHFYPSKEMKGEKLVGLRIESQELLKEDRLALVQKILIDHKFDGYVAKQPAKELYIMITEKKKGKATTDSAL